MDIFTWIQEECKPVDCASVDFMYDEMDSQSGYCLPVIYKPFDAADRAHWRDRGSCFDFLHAAGGEDKCLLDLGPGDGWPSLIVAPFVRKIVGVDGSRRRVDVCTENAERLGIQNAVFMYTSPGEPLPFDDGTFDGAMAATSIEQTPDPFRTLQELYRVLKKGGRLRIDYEALSQYRNGREREAYIDDRGSHESSLTLYERQIDRERVHMYKILFAMSGAALRRHFSRADGTPVFSSVTAGGITEIADRILEARRCTLTHPSGRTLSSWLRRSGWREVLPSHSGARSAAQLYDILPPHRHPDDLSGVDELVRPLVRIVVDMAAPIAADPMITAVK